MPKSKSHKSTLVDKIKTTVLFAVPVTAVVISIALVALFCYRLAIPAHYTAYRQSWRNQQDVTHVVKLHDVYVSDDNWVVGMSTANHQYKVKPLFYQAKDYVVADNREATIYTNNHNNIAIMNADEKTQVETMASRYEHSKAYHIEIILTFVATTLVILLILLLIIVYRMA